MTRRKVTEKFDVRVGDEWVFYTNTGGIARTITGIDDKYVYYRPYGDPYETQCLIATFRRWWRCANLNFRNES